MQASDAARTAHDMTAQYMAGQMRPHHPALLAAFQQESDAAAARPGATLDIAYGGHPRERFDFFAAAGQWRGTLAWFHAGYWQSRDKAQFRFLAPAFLADGIDVAMVNYPLCPDVTLPALIDAARASVAAVLVHARSLGRGGTALVAAGHSAGGHLAAELALTDWTSRGLPASPITAVVSISGVFDLEPLVLTPLNERLGLDLTTARAASPLHRARGAMPPAMFAVGGAETPAFMQQTAAMSAAWAVAGNDATSLVVDSADHFTILRDLEKPGALRRRIGALFERA